MYVITYNIILSIIFQDVFNTQHLKSTNIPRPQAKFKDMIDNSSSQFIPILYSKPNQIESLPEGSNTLFNCTFRIALRFFSVS